MARPRNKIAALPLEKRMVVAQMLADGHPYSAIKQALRDEGVDADAMPGNSSFRFYQQGDEYRTHMDEMLNWKRRAEEKKMIAQALGMGGGTESLVDLAIYEVTDELRTMVTSGKLEDRKDMAKVANALRGLKGVLMRENEEQLKKDLDEQRLAYEKQLAELRTRMDDMAKGGQQVDPVQVADRLNEILGVKKKK